MDTLKEYIKMCDCGEIQNTWEPRAGDNFIIGDALVPGDKHFAVSILGCCWEKCKGCSFEVNELRDECLWLPRQDQLQDMLEYKAKSTAGIRSAYGKVRAIVKFADSDLSDECQTMEQLWLSFVMHELHNKEWNGNEWKNI